MGWGSIFATSAVTAAFIGVALWLARNLIAERLKNAVKHEYDVKLTKIEADIHRRDSELEDLRRASLAAIASSQSAVETRRLRAIDELMDGLLQLKSGLSMSLTLAGINFEAISKRLSESKVQQFVDAITTGYDKASKDVAASGQTARVQPFVSPLAWALYSAYSGIITFDLARAAALRNRIPDAMQILDPVNVMKLVSAALPDKSDEVSQRGVRFFPDALQEIEKRLIAELRRLIVGGDSDTTGLERARAVAQALQSIETSKATAEIARADADQRATTG